MAAVFIILHCGQTTDYTITKVYFSFVSQIIVSALKFTIILIYGGNTL